MMCMCCCKMNMCCMNKREDMRPKYCARMGEQSAQMIDLKQMIDGVV